MLQGAGQLAFFQDDYTKAGEFWSALLAIGEATGDQAVISHALGRLSFLAGRLGEHDRAVALAEECMALGRESGDSEMLR